MKVSKPNMSNIWAEGGSIAVIPSEKISQGWVVEIPPCEQMNFVQNRQDAGIAYMLQQGIPEWDSSTEYQAVTSYAQFDGVVYKATGTSTNKSPATFPDFWEKAFDDAGSAQVVQDQLDAIEADADPFDQYLLEVDAAKYGIKNDLAVGNSLSSTNLNVIADGVWQFDSTCANKPFSSGKIMQNTSGTVKYQFSESLTQGIATRTSSSGVFTDWKYAVTNAAAFDLSALQAQVDGISTSLLATIERMKIKVGDLFITTVDYLAPSEVATHLGYGTWARWGEGHAMVGRSTVALHPAWTKVMGGQFGEYDHILTGDEIPAHTHSVLGYAGVGGSSPQINSATMAGSASSNTGNFGGGHAHNNVQNSQIAGIWYRTF